MAAYLFFLGLIAGSFLNVVIYRVPRNLNLSGRSRCFQCRRPLSWRELVPVASFFLFRKCRECGASLSARYPIVELASGALFAASYLAFGGISLDWVFKLFLLELFLVLALIDFERLVLPDGLILAGLIGTAAYAVAGGETFPAFSKSHLMAAAGCFLILFLLWFGSRGRWIGFGDAKFAFLIGLAFGPWGAVMTLYAAIALGAIAGIVLLVLRRANLATRLPFGSFLSVAAGLYVFGVFEILERTEWYLIRALFQ